MGSAVLILSREDACLAEVLSSLLLPMSVLVPPYVIYDKGLLLPATMILPQLASYEGIRQVSLAHHMPMQELWLLLWGRVPGLWLPPQSSVLLGCSGNLEEAASLANQMQKTTACCFICYGNYAKHSLSADWLGP